MKISAMVCATLAGALGLPTLAAAQERNWNRDGQRHEQRSEQRHAQGHDQRYDQRHRRDRDQQRGEWRQRDRSWQQPGVATYSTPHYYNAAPRYYNAPRSRYQRGGYLPYEYRQQSHYVSNWQAYPGLYAPPYGHQWMQVGSDYMLVALASGLIANLLMQ